VRDILIGGEGDDVVTGGGGDDGVLLDGGADRFVWKAGDGNDEIGGGLGRDQFDMRGAGGADSIRLAAAGLGLIDAAAGAETVALTSFERVRLTGLAGADRLEIGPMAGTGLTELIVDLAGAPGAASGDGAADEIVLRGTDGADDLTVQVRPGDFAVSGLGYTMAVRAMEAGDRLTFLGELGADRFDGAGLAALMTLDGGAGDDALTGGALADLISGRGDKDVLSGGLGDDRLFGGEGGDLMNGGDGIDRTNGGVGDDIHFVNSARDIVTEAAGQGADRVIASVSYILPLAAEIEQLGTNAPAGTAPIHLTGNDFSNIVTGNAAANMLSGRGADDSLSGGGGDDRLTGGAGGDRMRGGLGDDQFFCDQSGEAVEAAGEGTDTVFSTASYRLGNNIERLVLRGVAGEETKAGSGQGLEGIGNAGDNAIFGDAFANRIDGQAGNDRLTGGAGADRFAFSTALNAATNVDRILDFAPGSDTIALFSFVFGDLPTGPLAESAFATGAAAADETDRIIYDPGTGSLFFDADGLGGADQIRFAILQPGLAVGAADIEVFFAT
jgi:Ca2+-binding RTX toxin-like protein